MKTLIDNFKFIDILISSFLSAILGIKIYDILYKHCFYSNLNDFFTGTSIYLDYNKSLDIYIYFLYLIIFFLLLPMICIIRIKYFQQKQKQKENDIQQKKIILFPFIEKIKFFLLKFQFIGAIGFVFLYPLNGKFYPIIFMTVIFLILLSLFDVRKIKTKEKCNRFSILIITAVLFAILFSSYNVAYGPTDDHHFGEKFATFLMHNNFNLEYYKDIMLVHGYIDIIPSWIGCYIFQENNIYGYCLGEIFFENTLLILTLFSGLIVFDKNRLFMAPLLFFKGTNLTVFFITTYLLLLKEKLIEKRYIWLCIFSIISFIFCLTWTTIGSFWLIASIPILIYQIMQIYKQEDKKKVIKIIFALFPIIILMCLMHTTILEYLKEAPEYIKGNLYSFGNTFEAFVFIVPRLIVQTYKLFALFFLPVLLIELIKQIKNKGDAYSILFLLFSIIFPIISLSYTLGRTDNGIFSRIEFLSQAYLYVILPYFIYKYSTKKYNILLALIIIGVIFYSFLHLPSKFKSYNTIYSNYSLNNVGPIALSYNYTKRIENIKNFIENNSDKSSVFLDLTNRGMHYLYLNKKIPIKFISFYNAITTKQSDDITAKLKQTPPDIILIDSDSIFHDNIHLSLRLNSLYKYLLQPIKYNVVKDNENTFLIKDDKIKEYTQNDLKILDNIFGFWNLNFLPEVWGNSVKTLPIKEVIVDNYSYIYEDKLEINFPAEISGETFDFIYFEPENKTKEIRNYYIEINNSNSQIYCRTKRNGKLLVPFDNYPSWIINNSLKRINIYSNKKFKGKYKIKFYKRKSRNDI